MFRIKTRLTNLMFLSVKVRYISVWTSNNIVKCPFNDVVIPNMTVDQYVFRNLDKWSTKTAVVCGLTNRGYTYEQVYKLSRIFAANLRKKFTIKENKVVAVILPNAPEYPIITFGILAAGGIVNPINHVYTAYEIQRQLSSETSLIITNKEKSKAVIEAVNQLKKYIPIITMDINQSPLEGTYSYKELVNDNHVDLNILNEVKSNPDDIAFLPHSSGTSGLPKNVELTHKNIVSNCEQLNTEFRLYAHTTVNHQDNILSVLPMFHIYGLNVIMIHKISTGLKVITLPDFQPETFLNTLLSNKLSVLYLVPPLVMFLGSHPKVTAKHLEHVKAVVCGAAPLSTADIHRFLCKTKEEIQFLCGYGMTESAGVISINLLGRKKTAYEDVGYCLPNMEMRIVDTELKNLGANEFGELLIRGPNITKGYFKNPEATEAAFDGEWLRTGDMGKIDETGLLTISDRLKELIKVKGYQVAPAELENILKEHPAVLDAAVIGVPDDITGEQPRAFVVLKPKGLATDKEIIKFVSEKVAPYKKINKVSFVESIPKSLSGKILRNVIRDQYC